MARIPTGSIAKYTLGTLGIGGAGAAGGYSVASKKERKKLESLSSKAGGALRGQQRLIDALVNQNQSLKSAYLKTRQAVIRQKAGG